MTEPSLPPNTSVFQERIGHAWQRLCATEKYDPDLQIYICVNKLKKCIINVAKPLPETQSALGSLLVFYVCVFFFY